MEDVAAWVGLRLDTHLEAANMWTRRVLLATIVAAAAMSLPRHVPASWNVGLVASEVVAGSLR